MKKFRRPRLKLLSPSKPTSYKVGYGKPPTASRFKPGQSGNPKGRPKGARNKLPALNEERLKKLIIEEAYRTIKVTEGKRQITIPMVQAILRSQAMKAARGDHRAQQKFTELLSETERANKALRDAHLEEAIKYKIHWEEELQRRKELGATWPDPVPHPDHVVILRTGEVFITGPITTEEKIAWDQAHEEIKECDRHIQELNAMLNEEKSARRRRVFQDLIVRQMELRDGFARQIQAFRPLELPGYIRSPRDPSLNS
jgi:Family of unknown function (DUF5681)